MEKKGKMHVKKEPTVEEELHRLNVLYSPDEKSVSEEETEFRSSTSALTDSFRERLSSCEGLELLEDFMKVLDSWAKEDEEEEPVEEERPEREPYGEEEEGEEEEEREEQPKAEETAKKVEIVVPTEAAPKGEEVKLKKKRFEGEGETKGKETLEGERTLDEDEKMKIWDAKRLFAYRLVEKDAPKIVEELEFFTQEDGMILVKDIAYVLRSFGCNPTERDVSLICQAILKEHGDRIDKVSFLSYLFELQRQTFTTKDILGVFKSLDIKNTGKIRNRLLRTLLSERRERLNIEELIAFFKEGDPTKSGFINYGEFVRRMDRNIYIAVPEKRRYLVKLLRREDKRAGRDSADDTPRSFEKSASISF